MSGFGKFNDARNIKEKLGRMTNVTPGGRSNQRLKKPGGKKLSKPVRDLLDGGFPTDFDRDRRARVAQTAGYAFGGRLPKKKGRLV